MWFIMSYNALDGYHRGAFQDLNGLFYAGPEGRIQEWVPILSEAKGYESMEAAQEEAYAIWGPRFVDRSFVFLRGPGEINDDDCRRLIDVRDSVSRRIASRNITRLMLKAMALHRDADLTGLTWREQQIIKIMTKGEN